MFRQKSAKDSSTHLDQDEPILCDGCDKHINEEEYIAHWEVCIQKRREKEVKLAEADLKRKQKQEEKMKQIMKQQQLKKEQQKRQKEECPKCKKLIQPGPKTIQNHQTICTQRQEKCQFCQESFPFYLMSQHFDICEMKKVIEQSLKQSSMVRSSPARSSQPIIINNQRQAPIRPANQPRELQYNFAPQQQQIFDNQNRRQSNDDLLEQFYKSLRKREKLSDKQIMQLPKIKFKQSKTTLKDNDICSICQSKLQAQQMVIVLDCEHIFHSQCLEPWLKKTITCPNCTKNVKKH